MSRRYHRAMDVSMDGPRLVLTPNTEADISFVNRWFERATRPGGYIAVGTNEPTKPEFTITLSVPAE
ncbi:MAG: hypothetical protein NVSMB64_32060 [Candidatus Velthaea sp.]